MKALLIILALMFTVTSINLAPAPVLAASKKVSKAKRKRLKMLKRKRARLRLKAKLQRKKRARFKFAPVAGITSFRLDDREEAQNNSSTGFTGGLALAYRNSKHVQLESGIRYFQLRSVFEETDPKLGSRDRTLDYLGFPFLAKIFVLGRPNDFFFKVGMMPTTLLQAQEESERGSLELEELNRNDFFIVGGIGVQFRLARGIRLFAEMDYNYGLNPIQNDKDRYYNHGFTGISGILFSL